MKFIEKVEVKGAYITGEVLLEQNNNNIVNNMYVMKVKTVLCAKPNLECLTITSINEFIKELQEIKNRMEKLEQTLQK